MPSIDERVVSMAFENAKFEAGVAQTMATLTKLDTAIKNVGSGGTGLQNIEAAANKVTLQGPMSALDKLKARLSGAGQGAAEGLGEIDKAGNKVTLEGPSTAVDKLQSKMGQLSAGSTFSDIEKASNQVELNGLSRALDTVTAKFSLLEGAAAVALGNITSQAVAKGANFAKSFGVGPIIDGLHEYETNLKSIQTIQANTDRPLTEINKSLEELNRYSDQTIYNFSEMARNIGTFTAAGVDLKTATSSIKGIANMAALSGSSSQQAATAMYQLSQAISSGKVGLQDWNSVVNAGMGGKKLQTALATTGIAMGKIGEETVKLEGPLKKLTINGQSFRESIMTQGGVPSWLSSDILVNTLATLDGRFSKAALSAELTKDGLRKYSDAQVEAEIATARTALEQKNGVKYTDEQFASLMKLSDSAFKSATEVKTLGQVFDVARETIGSGWAASFQSIFGNLTEAKKTFTELSGVINGFINANALARNTVLHDWKAMGGRTELIEGIKQAFQNVIAILKPIKDAFRDIFPAKTGKDLFEMTKNFTDLMKKLEPSKETVDSLRRIFAGFFAVLSIGWTVVKEVAGVIADLLGAAGKGSGGFLTFAAGIADFFVGLDKAISKGQALSGFFDGLSAVLKVPVELLKTMAGLIGDLFGKGDAGGAEEFSTSMDNVKTSAKPLADILDRLGEAWDKLVRILNRIKEAIAPTLQAIATEIANIANMVKQGIETADWDSVFLALQTTFIGGLFLAVKKALGGGIGDIGGGVLENVNGILKGVTGNLEAMQKNVKADMILKIAIATGVLAAAIFVLSTIDAEDLSKAMTAVAVGMGQLIVAMKLLTSGGLGAGVALMPVIAVALIGLSVALVILAGAMKIMATMEWEELAKGLIGLGGALAAVGIGVKMIGPSVIPAALAMIPLAIGLNLLALAIKQLAGMKWEELARGLAGIGGALLVIVAGMSIMPPTLPVTAAGVLILSAALLLLSGAISSFGAMDPVKLGQGLLGVGLALSAIGLAVALIPPTIALTAAGLLILSAALMGIAGVVAIFGNMDIGTLVKGIVAMGAALIVLGFGLIAMSGTLGGTVALLAAAAALAILAPTLGFLGTLAWGTIFKGLAAIALVLGVLSVVGLLASSGLVALGGALAVLGLAMLLISGAVYVAAKGISLLAESGQKGVAALLVALTGFVAIFPTIVINFVKGLLEIAKGVADLAPKIIQALGIIINQIIAFVIESAPKLAIAIGVLVLSFLQVINDNAPKIISAGWKLLQDFLSGISNNIGQVVTKVVDIVTKFANALVQNAPKLVESGAKVLVAFLNGITNKIPKLVETVAILVTKFINSVAAQIPKIIQSGVNLIVNFLNGIANNIGKVIKAGTNLILSFMDGVGDAIPRLVTKGLEVARKFLNGIADGLSGLADVGFKAIIRFLNGLEKAIRDNSDDLVKAGAGIADAIVDAMTDQFGKAGGILRGAIEKVFSLLPGWAKKVLGISSPSKVFAELGMYTMQGFAKGIGDNHQIARSASENIGHSVIGGVRDTLGIHSPSEVMKELGKEVGRGFAQGLEGSADDIRNSFQSLNDKLKDQIRTSKETIVSEQAKLDDLLKAKKPDYEAIKAAQKAILENEAILRASKAAHAELTIALKDEKQELIALTGEYDAVTEKLEEAQRVLDEATRARDEARKSYQTKYATTPDIELESPTALEDYKKSLQERIEATKKYAETLQKLRALGLDDTTYKKLLEEGTEGQAFAEQLLAGGKTAVEGLNTLDAELLAVSTKLADNAAVNLYQAGVNAAQGLVDGLKSKQTELATIMEELANSIVLAMKKKLKIKSPSQIFGEIGKFAAEGLAKGLTDSSKTVTDAASDLGADTVSALQSSIGDISGAIVDNINVEPVITPVLDLSQVTTEAKKLDGLTNVVPITAAASFDQAATISASQTAAETAAADQAAKAGPTFQFEQNNYSPEALSDVEIYRQTKNQLSQVKVALGLSS